MRSWLPARVAASINDVEEPTAGAETDADPCYGNGCMACSGACAADQHDVPLLLDEAAAGEATHQCFVHRCGVEPKSSMSFERQLGDRHLELLPPLAVFMHSQDRIGRRRSEDPADRCSIRQTAAHEGPRLP